jgi:hypothetical protein
VTKKETRRDRRKRKRKKKKGEYEQFPALLTCSSFEKNWTLRKREEGKY